MTKAHSRNQLLDTKLSPSFVVCCHQFCGCVRWLPSYSLKVSSACIIRPSYAQIEHVERIVHGSYLNKYDPLKDVGGVPLLYNIYGPASAVTCNFRGR